MGVGIYAAQTSVEVADNFLGSIAQDIAGLGRLSKVPARAMPNAKS